MFDCVAEIACTGERSGGWGFSTWDNPRLSTMASLFGMTLLSSSVFVGFLLASRLGLSSRAAPLTGRPPPSLPPRCRPLVWRARGGS